MGKGKGGLPEDYLDQAAERRLSGRYQMYGYGRAQGRGRKCCRRSEESGSRAALASRFLGPSLRSTKNTHPGLSLEPCPASGVCPRPSGSVELCGGLAPSLMLIAGCWSCTLPLVPIISSPCQCGAQCMLHAAWACTCARWVGWPFLLHHPPPDQTACLYAAIHYSWDRQQQHLRRGHMRASVRARQSQAHAQPAAPSRALLQSSGKQCARCAAAHDCQPCNPCTPAPSTHPPALSLAPSPPPLAPPPPKEENTP